MGVARGQSACMRGDQDIVERPKDMVYRKRFGCGDIKPGTRNPTGLEGFCQCILVDQVAASNIEYIGSFRQQGNPSCIQQMLGLLGGCCTKGDIVGLSKERIKFGFGTQLIHIRGFFCRCSFYSQHPQSMGFRP